MWVIIVVFYVNGGVFGEYISVCFDEINKMFDYVFNNFKVKEV